MIRAHLSCISKNPGHHSNNDVEYILLTTKKILWTTNYTDVPDIGCNASFIVHSTKNLLTFAETVQF